VKKYIFTLAIIFVSSTSSGVDLGACHGAFPNLITDICWDCAFPIKLFGGIVIKADNQEDYDSGNIPNLCVCTRPGSIVPKPGFHTSFWEFARQAEVTRTPYCMVSLGVTMDMGINNNAMGTSTMEPGNAHGNRTTFRHAHWYINPAMGLLQILLDSKCLEPRGFDIAYLSEIDPTHIDEELERILNPESFLFGNIVSQLACSADCVTSTIGFGSNLLYWCGGCQGSVYPMTGFMPNTYGGVQASSLMVHKVTAKLHRMLTQWSAAGNAGMCSYIPQINMDKRQYKYSMIYPSSQSSGDTSTYSSAGTATPAQSSSFNRCCQPYGRTTVLWGAMREIPITGEDFAYAIFRKRDCCQ
jgi:conjugal transfer pilus assembly protein TraU